MLKLVFALLFATTAWAQPYPAKPIRIVVPYPPGGNADLVARPIAQELGRILNVPVIIDNRGGATGSIGADAVARAPADGYTLLFATNNEMSVMSALQPNLPYDPVKSFEPITLVATFPFALVTRRSLPVRTINELVTLAKQKPGTLTIASAGNGSANHLIIEPFKSLFAIDVTHVPYKGGGPALADLVAGHVDASFATLTSIVGHVRSGKLTPLMVTSDSRSPVLPDVPSAAELGYHDLVATNWNALFAPIGTPKDIIGKLHAALVSAAKEPAVQARVAGAGATIETSTPAALSTRVASELARWSKVVKEARITPD